MNYLSIQVLMSSKGRVETSFTTCIPPTQNNWKVQDKYLPMFSMLMYKGIIFDF